jgi:hypothetical protein
LKRAYDFSDIRSIAIVSDEFLLGDFADSVCKIFIEGQATTKARIWVRLRIPNRNAG